MLPYGGIQRGRQIGYPKGVCRAVDGVALLVADISLAASPQRDAYIMYSGGGVIHIGDVMEDVRRSLSQAILSRVDIAQARPREGLVQQGKYPGERGTRHRRAAVPASAAPGPQAVIVTVGTAASDPVTLTIAPADAP